MRRPILARTQPSLVALNFEYIFVIGGRNPWNIADDYFKSVHRFKISGGEEDVWTDRIPSLNQARFAHSSCISGDNKALYTICGYDRDQKYIESIERLLVSEMDVGADSTKTWERIELTTYGKEGRLK